MGPKYKIGDLIVLNEFGRLVIDENRIRIGLIVSGPTNMFYSINQIIDEEQEPFYYWAYDIMIGDELVTEVPQEFLENIVYDIFFGDK